MAKNGWRNKDLYRLRIPLRSYCQEGRLLNGDIQRI